jgi:hypothetical protein
MMESILFTFLGCILGYLLWDIVKFAIRRYRRGGRDDA